MADVKSASSPCCSAWCCSSFIPASVPVCPSSLPNRVGSAADSKSGDTPFPVPASADASEGGRVSPPLSRDDDDGSGNGPWWLETHFRMISSTTLIELASVATDFRAICGRIAWEAMAGGRGVREAAGVEKQSWNDFLMIYLGLESASEMPKANTSKYTVWPATHLWTREYWVILKKRNKHLRDPIDADNQNRQEPC